MNRNTQEEREAILARDREERAGQAEAPTGHTLTKHGQYDWSVTFVYPTAPAYSYRPKSGRG